MRAFAVVSALLLVSGVLVAQPGPGSGGRGGATPAQRAELEARVRERMAEVVKTRLALTDDQTKKLGDVNRKYEERRRLLNDQERDVRMGIRDQMLADKPDEQKVGDLLDRMMRVQKQRFELVEAEQKELAAFLTPTQRVKYFTLQDEAKKWRQDMQRRSMDRRGGPGRTKAP